jgi:hypothetical protein
MLTRRVSLAVGAAAFALLAGCGSADSSTTVEAGQQASVPTSAGRSTPTVRSLKPFPIGRNAYAEFHLDHKPVADYQTLLAEVAALAGKNGLESVMVIDPVGLGRNFEYYVGLDSFMAVSQDITLWETVRGWTDEGVNEIIASVNRQTAETNTVAERVREGLLDCYFATGPEDDALVCSIGGQGPKVAVVSIISSSSPSRAAAEASKGRLKGLTTALIASKRSVLTTKG